MPKYFKIFLVLWYFVSIWRVSSVTLCVCNLRCYSEKGSPAFQFAKGLHDTHRVVCSGMCCFEKEELHSLKCLEAQQNFSASWEVTGWKFYSKKLCLAHHLSHIFDQEPLFLKGELLTLCGHHALQKHLGRCYLKELTSNTLTSSIKREFPRYI